MNIVLVVYSPAPGGAERVALTLANEFAAAGDSVALCTLDEDCAAPFFSIRPEVRLVKLGRYSGKVAARSRLNRSLAKYVGLRREIRRCKPGLVVSFTSQVNVLVLLALAGLSLRVFVSERSDPRIIPTNRIFRLLRSVCYRWFAYSVLVQSEYARSYFARRGYPRVTVAANPVVPPTHEVPECPRDDGRVVIYGVGRLVPEKRWNMLVEAVAILVRRAGDANRLACSVIGDGPDRARLMKLISDLGLSGNVTMPGFKENPWQGVRPYDIYVQCSRFEGFPNALFEAMSIGCAVVSTRYSPAADEILEDGVNVILVDHGEPDALATILESLSGNVELRRRLGDAARRSMVRFRPESVVSQWRLVLESV